MTGMYRREYRNLIRAIARIYLHDLLLTRRAGRLRDFYVHGAELPPGEEPLSVSLRCERNGAHGYLEELFTEIKRLGRGKVPERTVQRWLFEPADRLLNELRNIAKLLPRELDALADDLRRRVEATRNVEMAVTNLILGRSGIDAEAPTQEWCTRLNKLLRDMKQCFNANCMAFDDIEVALERRRSAAPSARKTVRRRSTDTAQALMRKDLADIRKEANRRYEAQVKLRLRTSLKKVLEQLCKDAAWSRRCQQWRFDTLYQYVVESP